MKLFTLNRSKNFVELPAKKQEKLLLKAAKGANKRQADLERKYLKVYPRGAS